MRSARLTGFLEFYSSGFTAWHVSSLRCSSWTCVQVPEIRLVPPFSVPPLPSLRPPSSPSSSGSHMLHPPPLPYLLEHDTCTAAKSLHQHPTSDGSKICLVLLILHNGIDALEPPGSPTSPYLSWMNLAHLFSNSK